MKGGSAQTINSNTDTVVTFIDDFDPQGWITSNKFQPTIAGYYNIQVSVWWDAGSITTNQNNIQIRQNGSTQVAIQQNQILTGAGYGQEIDVIVYFNGTTDYIEVTAYTGNTTSQNINGSSSGTWITGSLILGGGAAGSSGTSGSSSDYLSTLTGAEIAITTTATATISRQHLISGTSADYTVTLPAASGNTGKFIGIRIDGSATRLFTIKGNASELIDGLNTRIMWKSEAAILYCDGTGWKKMAGVSYPMSCQMYQTSILTTLFTNNNAIKVPVTGVAVNNTGLMANTGSNRIDIKRAGLYSIKGAVSFNSMSANSPRCLTQIQVNLSGIGNSECSALSTGYPTPFFTTDYTLAAGNYIELYGLQNSGSTQGVWGNATLIATMVLATEIITW